MAREIRVPAAPDFHRTIFVEFQTSEMSADGINYMATHRPKKIPPKTSNLHSPYLIADQKGFGRGLGKPFPQKGFPNTPALPPSLSKNAKASGFHRMALVKRRILWYYIRYETVPPSRRTVFRELMKKEAPHGK